MNFVVLVAALSGANASLYAATRLLHALGSDRMAPAVAARTSSRGVPVVALLISFTGVVVATVMAVAKIGDIFALLMALVTLCILVVWVMILLTYQAYKKDQKDASSFTVLGGRVTAGLALAGVLATLAAMFAARLGRSGIHHGRYRLFVLISLAPSPRRFRAVMSAPIWTLCTPTRTPARRSIKLNSVKASRG